MLEENTKKRKVEAPENVPPLLRIITSDDLGLLRGRCHRIINFVAHSILISDAAVADVPPTWDGAEVVSRW